MTQLYTYLKGGLLWGVVGWGVCMCVCAHVQMCVCSHILNLYFEQCDYHLIFIHKFCLTTSAKYSATAYNNKKCTIITIPVTQSSINTCSAKHNYLLNGNCSCSINLRKNQPCHTVAKNYENKVIKPELSDILVESSQLFQLLLIFSFFFTPMMILKSFQVGINIFHKNIYLYLLMYNLNLTLREMETYEKFLPVSSSLKRKTLPIVEDWAM